MNVFIVIPLCNEKLHIFSVLKNLEKFNLPIVVVDDGSVDGSHEEITRSKNKKVTLLSHKINLGKGAAMKTGAEYAFKSGADAVIFMDSDNQHDVDDIPSFLNVLNKRKYEVIFGSRNMSYGVPFIRYMGNKIASVVMVFLFKIYVSDAICGYRAVTNRGYNKIKWESDGYGVEIEMVARVGKAHIKHCEIPVKTIYNDRVKGVTILDAFGILAQVVKWRLTL